MGYGVVTVRVNTNPVEYVPGASVVHDRCMRRNTVLLHGSLVVFFCICRAWIAASVVVMAFQVPKSARRHSRSLSALPPPRVADEARIATVLVRSTLAGPVRLTVNKIPVGSAMTPAL